ncbi:unnamed protein product [Camellia sinensis]
MGNKEGLTDDPIANNIIYIVFAAYYTTVSVLTWIIKYFVKNHSVLPSFTAHDTMTSVLRLIVEYLVCCKAWKTLWFSARCLMVHVRTLAVVSRAAKMIVGYLFIYEAFFVVTHEKIL